MISSTSTKNISPRGTQRMAAPSVTAAITVSGQQDAQHGERRACEAEQAMATAIVDDQARAGDDLAHDALLRGSPWPYSIASPPNAA